MFLAIVSRPDISMAVSTLSQFYTCYTKDHYQAAIRILRYIKGTTNLGIRYSKCGNELKVYSDSDFAGDPDTCVSRTGTLVMLNCGPVVWLSQKQACNTLSSTEAEFVAATSASCYIIWLRNLLQELGLPVEKPVDLLMDNQSAIKLIKNPEYHHRTKHIKMKYKFVRRGIQPHDRRTHDRTDT